MPYRSVDQLQNVLAGEVFHYTQDAKKASGRALGTLVEIITFYLLKSGGFENSIAIERSLSEYGNPDITHNVEFSIHPILRKYELTLPEKLPLTSSRILLNIGEEEFPVSGFTTRGNVLLTSGMVLRNSCMIALGGSSHIVANLVSRGGGSVKIT